MIDQRERERERISYLLFRSWSWRHLRSNKAFTTLLLQALFTTVLTDLDHVVLPTTAAFLGVHRHLVAVPPHLGPGVWSQRHGLWSAWESKIEESVRERVRLRFEGRVCMCDCEWMSETVRWWFFLFVCSVLFRLIRNEMKRRAVGVTWNDFIDR